MDYSKYKTGEKGPLDKKIKEIIFRSNDAIVYLDEFDVIQWSTIGDLLPQMGGIINEVSYWETICNKIFDKKDSFDYKCLLAEAYARILDEKNLDDAKEVISMAKSRIEKQGKEILKQNYIISSLILTILTIVLLITFVLLKPYLSEIIDQDKYEIIISSFFGGIGAFLFTIKGLKEYKADVVISKNIHRVDGILRVFYGLIAGAIIAICIKSNLFLGFVQDIDKSIYVYAFLGVVAGASEVLIPNLIKQIEQKS